MIPCWLHLQVLQKLFSRSYFVVGTIPDVVGNLLAAL